MGSNKKKSLFYYCFPCISKPAEDPDETVFRTFAKDFTEYEYVIENLAIRRAPKILLDQYQPPPKIKTQKKKKTKQIKKTKTQTKKPKVKDFSSVVARGSTTCDVAGPVVKIEECGDSFECCPRGGPKCTDKVKEDVLKKILVPPYHVFRVEHPIPRLQKVSADVHKTSDSGTPVRRRQSIPSEIKETIDALKVAKPPQSSSSPRKNRRHLVRSQSDTSCDKETFCNFLGTDLKNEKRNETRSSIVDVYTPQSKRKNVLKFPSIRKYSPRPKMMEPSEQGPDVKNQQNRNENATVKTTVTDTNIESEINSNLKWKIVINKHKELTTSESEKKSSK